MTVIELGERPRGGSDEPPDEAPRPPGVGLRLVALCVVALLTLAGSAPAAYRRPGRAVPAPQGASFLVVAGRLVVADGPGTVGGGGRVVTGHRLPDGRLLWRFVLPVGDHVLGLSTVAGLLLVTSSPAGAGDTLSTVLDPGSGVLRWRGPGYPVPTQSGGLLFETPRADGTGTIRSVDPASGQTRWSLPLPGPVAAYRNGDRGVVEIVLVTPDGRVSVHDAGSGALRQEGRVFRADDRAGGRSVQVVGDLLLVGGTADTDPPPRGDPPPETVVAYGLDRLDRRWSVPVPTRAGTWFSDCGRVVCLHDQLPGVRAFDPATGRQLWTDERWLGVSPVGDRLLAAAPADGPELDRVALDPGTGRVVTRFGRWRLAGGDDAGALQLGLRRLPTDRTLVGTLDVATGRTRLRAVLPGSWDGCVDAGTQLVCLRPSGGLVVWPVER
ncbi:outer membrane protein assembly factor BamB family protein [Micromonospora auratinigra]|uniref:PQQ-like domain-containing protein n=1 Tax=Micromonospora auratinigra TaxID=261654 RepID=A0A1A9ABZ4_9ACTN|nr:PQQ-binding-like beta-propeller repeat protein [Micromonospora auratinigra]SBT53658.1 PQQ-like domain-containing protein [Micromonospora auratinigra]